jgi:hypothetical protein
VPDFQKREVGVERVGLVVLSIVVATALVVGASYGAMWLQPYLWHFTKAGWMLSALVTVLPLAYVLARRKRA